VTSHPGAERRRFPAIPVPVTEDPEDLAALAHAATHDLLTGLPNRSLLHDRLAQALEAHREGSAPGGLAVIFFDLDGFKKVNDSLGHRAGDELLSEAAQRILGIVRPSDVVARFGGDEFVVVCEGLSWELEALGVADRIRQTLERPFWIDGQDVYVSASLGVSYPRSPDDDADSLLSDADAAMFEAKRRGRGRTEPYDRKLRERARERLLTEAALRSAVDRHELRLAFQPVVEMATGRMTGVEALIRWDHPLRGPLPPGAFIRLAEDTGLIPRIGAWAVSEACAHQAEWDRLARPPTTAVNVSARQLARPELRDTLESALASTGADPSHLQLEITESAVVEDPVAGRSAMNALKAQGVKLVLDDFGTGYASLSALRRFPLDGIKIDRSFVEGIVRHYQDRAIVAAVIRLGSDLGLEVVAEGVESADQRDLLVEMGCRLGQGYFFSPPLGAAEVTARMEGE
jgi:diguanylate cyclase (GGDEF)-like protein